MIPGIQSCTSAVSYTHLDVYKRQGVDRLIVIANYGKARAAAHQQFHQFILAGVGVLLLIPQQVANFVLPALADFFIALQQ